MGIRICSYLKVRDSGVLSEPDCRQGIFGVVKMVKCNDCGKEMLRAKTCSAKRIWIQGVLYPRDSIHFDKNERCHDCNIENKKGNYHHFGCDMEKCPKCGGQLISCGCLEG